MICHQNSGVTFSSRSSTLTSLLPRALNPHIAVVDLVASHLTASAADGDDETKPLELSRLLPYLGHDELTAVVLRTGHSHPLLTLRFLLALPLPVQPSSPHLAFLAHSLASSRLFSHALDALSHLLRLYPGHDALPTLLLSIPTAPHPSLPGLLVKALLDAGEEELADGGGCCCRTGAPPPPRAPPPPSDLSLPLSSNR